MTHHFSHFLRNYDFEQQSLVQELQIITLKPAKEAFVDGIVQNTRVAMNNTALLPLHIVGEGGGVKYLYLGKDYILQFLLLNAGLANITNLE